MDEQEPPRDPAILATEAVTQIQNFLKEYPVGSPACEALNDEALLREAKTKISSQDTRERSQKKDSDTAQSVSFEMQELIRNRNDIQTRIEDREGSTPGYYPGRSAAWELLNHVQRVHAEHPSEFTKTIDPHVPFIEHGTALPLVAIRSMIKQAQPVVAPIPK